MPATDAIDAAALGKHLYMHNLYNLDRNTECLLFVLFCFLIAASIFQVTVCICYRSKLKSG